MADLTPAEEAAVHALRKDGPRAIPMPGGAHYNLEQAARVAVRAAAPIIRAEMKQELAAMRAIVRGEHAWQEAFDRQVTRAEKAEAQSKVDLQLAHEISDARDVLAERLNRLSDGSLWQHTDNGWRMYSPEFAEKAQNAVHVDLVQAELNALRSWMTELADDTERLMNSREPDVGTSLQLVVRLLRERVNSDE